MLFSAYPRRASYKISVVKASALSFSAQEYENWYYVFYSQINSLSNSSQNSKWFVFILILSKTSSFVMYRILSSPVPSSIV